MEICAVIVARGGSKRIPRKSLLKLNGESLIARKIRQLRSCKKINRIVFGSDSEEMLLEAKSHGAPLNFDPSSIPRSQDLPVLYKETIGCFVFTRQMFLETGRRIGYRPYICEVDKIEETDINYPEDFEIANVIYMHRLKKDAGGI